MRYSGKAEISKSFDGSAMKKTKRQPQALAKVVERPWLSLLNKSEQIVCQTGFPVGCGYASILNSLLFNASGFTSFAKAAGMPDLQRLRNMKKQYGHVLSTNHKRGTRHRYDGLIPEDVLVIFNEIRAGCELAR